MEDNTIQVKLNVPVIAIVAIVGLAAIAGYLYWRQTNLVPESSITSSFAEEDLRRIVDGAGIESTVTLMNPLLAPNEVKHTFVFKVALDTHMGNIMQYDLAQLAVLRTNEDQTITEGFIWEPKSDSSHHRLGFLKVVSIADGKPLITPDTEYVELELKDIGIPSRLFKWESGFFRTQSDEPNS